MGDGRPQRLVNTIAKIYALEYGGCTNLDNLKMDAERFASPIIFQKNWQCITRMVDGNDGQVVAT